MPFVDQRLIFYAGLAETGDSEVLAGAKLLKKPFFHFIFGTTPRRPQFKYLGTTYYGPQSMESHNERRIKRK